MFIYLVTNLIDGKMYVGKTEKEIRERWKTHIENSKNPKRHQEYLYRAIRKHGLDNFSLQCITETESADDLNQLERLWILSLCTHAPHGYNMTYGGDGVPGTPEVREKIRLKAVGRPTSALQKETASKLFRGKPKPFAQRQKMAAHWDKKRREKQARIAVAVNKIENAKLRDFECPDCGTKFEQVTKGVYGGHRRYCLHYRIV